LFSILYCNRDKKQRKFHSLPSPPPPIKDAKDFDMVHVKNKLQFLKTAPAKKPG
jgi:hypothetical protein